MTQDLTHIVDFRTHIPDRDDHQPYLLDLFLCSNLDSSTVASHSPSGKSDHMGVDVDVKFVVKSRNEHPYHRTCLLIQQGRLGLVEGSSQGYAFT